MPCMSACELAQMWELRSQQNDFHLYLNSYMGLKNL